MAMPTREAECRSATALLLAPALLTGDSSMAGERGINLSGGQRQRVCLARAAYHDADLVLLDNPLSAVDQHTSKHIFDRCIKGLLADKAVVLIAHQLELLPQVGEVLTDQVHLHMMIWTCLACMPYIGSVTHSVG